MDQCDDAEAACVAFEKPAGSNGFFCAAARGDDGACPAGAYCDLRSTIAGDTALVCVPKSETCACSTKAKAAGWTTACFGVAFGADGLISKQCAGSWTCAFGGCSATHGPNETCNGKDDDCDGKIDEDNVCQAEGKCASAADCDDSNACTGHACAAGACSHTAIAGSCLDKFDCPTAKNCAPPIACVAKNAWKY
jgi:hypothetical protein